MNVALIDSYIEDLLDVLEIEEIEISYDDSVLKGTELAAYIPEDNVMIISKKRIPDMVTLFFAIAHELRHVYQIKEGIINLQHKKSSEIGIAHYNEQEEEVDANAFACVVLEEFFSVIMESPFLSNEKVLQQKEEIKKTEKFIYKEILFCSEKWKEIIMNGKI